MSAQGEPYRMYIGFNGAMVAKFVMDNGRKLG
jgi:hypothetical protein